MTWPREPTKRIAPPVIFLLALAPLAVTALFLSGVFSAHDIRPQPPRPFSELATTNLRGEPARLERYKNKVVLLDVWATWCAPCVEALPRLQSLHERYSDGGFTVIGVSVEEGGKQAMPAFLKNRRVIYPMLLDGRGENSVRKAFAVRSVPTLLLFDRRGKPVKRWTEQPSDEELNAAIIHALQED